MGYGKFVCEGLKPFVVAQKLLEQEFFALAAPGGVSGAEQRKT